MWGFPQIGGPDIDANILFRTIGAREGERVVFTAQPKRKRGLKTRLRNHKPYLDPPM